jgi:hypothetical protein
MSLNLAFEPVLQITFAVVRMYIMSSGCNNRWQPVPAVDASGSMT